MLVSRELQIRAFLPILIMMMVVVVFGYSTVVSALPSTDIKAIYRDSVHYALPVGVACGGTGATADSNEIPVLVGSSNEEKTYNYLVSKGLSPQQAAGIMGNLAVESGFIPNNQQNGQPWPTQGWGIAQWTEGRRDNLKKKVEAANLPYIADKADGGRDLTPEENDALLGLQLKFLYEESNQRKMRDNPNTTEWEGLKAVSGSDAVKESVIYWEYNFERAGKPALGNRHAFAEEFFAKYGSSDGSNAAPQACGNNGAGGFALPVDKKWYDDHKDWFTKPHHDYPSADIPVPEGTKIYAAAPGTIKKAPIVTSDTSYGQGVWIEGDDGYTYIYGHGQDGGSIDGAKVGDHVSAGQFIMHSGNTGNSFGAHLHFEIRDKGGGLLCPQDFLVAAGEGRTPDLASLPKSGCSY